MRATLGILVVGWSLAILSAGALASSGDYRFEVVGPLERVPGGSVLTVRLIHSPGDHLITDADVFRRMMESRHKAIPAIDERRVHLQSNGTGYYRLLTPYELTPGTSIKLGAQVPGKSASIRGSVQVPK